MTKKTLFEVQSKVFNQSMKEYNSFNFENYLIAKFSANISEEN